MASSTSRTPMAVGARRSRAMERSPPGPGDSHSLDLAIPATNTVVPRNSGVPMRASYCAPPQAPAKLLVLALALLPAACGTYRGLRAPAVPHDAYATPRTGQVSDSALARLLRESGIVVLGTPVDRVSEEGVFTPWMQMGNKQTWYSFRFAVDSV